MVPSSHLSPLCPSAVYCHIGAKSQEEAAQRTSRGHGVQSFRPVDLIPSVEAGATASSSSKSSTAAAGDSGQSDGLAAGQAGFQSLLTSSYSSSSPVNTHFSSFSLARMTCQDADEAYLEMFEDMWMAKSKEGAVHSSPPDRRSPAGCSYSDT